MKNKLVEDRPIYSQIKEQIEEMIIDEKLHADDRVPSTNDFAKHYQINPATAAKGINELVAEAILYKRRGVGMFVSGDAKSILKKKRKAQFVAHHIKPLQEEAKRLGISIEELIAYIKEGESNEN